MEWVRDTDWRQGSVIAPADLGACIDLDFDHGRHALPDELVERLSPLLSFLNKKLKPSAVEIAGIWIDYDPKGSVLADEPYELWMYVVYNYQEGKDAQAKAEGLASDLGENFDRLILKNRGAGPVELNECMAVSEVTFTLDDLRRNTELKMEHLSHRAFPAGDLIYD